MKILVKQWRTCAVAVANAIITHMEKIEKYLWYIPALYVAYMFGNKLIEGLGHSEEFAQIISVIPALKNFAYTLTPLVGIWDFTIAIALLLTPTLCKNRKVQTGIFIWVMVWPFLPASLRYFGGVGDFEIIEVLSISFSGLAAYLLWKKFTAKDPQKGSL